MKLEWTVFALADRDDIFDFIERDSPLFAVKVDEIIEAQAERLIDFPDSGRPGRIEGTREWVIPSLSYIIAYRVLLMPCES